MTVENRRPNPDNRVVTIERLDPTDVEVDYALKRGLNIKLPDLGILNVARGNEVCRHIVAVDASGGKRIVSPAFDEIGICVNQVLPEEDEEEDNDKKGDFHLLFGRQGKLDYPLSLERGEGGLAVVAEWGYEQIGFREDLGGVWLGFLEGEYYILDPITGRPVSNGYKRIDARVGYIFGETLDGKREHIGQVEK
jgi:hypothetical protein